MNVLDLFSGACGGWSLGLERAGFHTIAACEIDPWRRLQYGRNFPDVRQYDDVRELTAERLRHDGVPAVDIVAGSPPCQDASTANAKGKGIDGERTGLFWEAVRLVRELRPRWVCLENVPGIRTRGYDRIQDELEAADYTAWPLVVGAWHAGLNHRRNRVWIIAHAKEIEWRPRNGESDDAGAYGRQPNHGTSRDASDTPVLFRPSVTRDQSDGNSACRWADVWRESAPDLCGMDDGLPKGLARHLLAAYGDTVLPQITEAIGRAILTVEASLEG